MKSKSNRRNLQSLLRIVGVRGTVIRQTYLQDGDLTRVDQLSALYLAREGNLYRVKDVSARDIRPKDVVVLKYLGYAPSRKVLKREFMPFSQLRRTLETRTEE